MKSIVIAGATGFIGRWFIDRFSKKYQIIALSRNTIHSESYPEVDWRMADLYSLSNTTEALKGADYALYLVHSMQPSTRLNQGSFEDTDLLLADNFARAAEICKLKQIVFIGGILPKDTGKFSTHLQSRYETEQTLGSRSVPLTALRAGIIIGPGGSSFEIVKKLVRRLPIMVCPKWCKSPSQPIDVEDMLLVINNSLGNKKLYGQSVEVGGRETLTYMELLKRTSEIMGKKRLIFSIPFFNLGFSKLWVALFSNSSQTFVSPLIESLRHDMTIKEAQTYTYGGLDVSMNESIQKATESKAPGLKKQGAIKEEKNTVRSVQRLSNPGNKSVEWVAKAYPKWLPTFFTYILTAQEEEDEISFQLVGFTLLKLKYMPERSDDKRKLFFIIGGLLSKRGDHGWLEFRSVLKNKHIIAAIHEFVPSLPWIIYRYTQAVAHLVVMMRFDKFLMRQEKT
ncbi:MAG: NAD(P)H-binding protein [Bacteroidota bacterium]